jgi:hypothetical protein
MFFFSQNSNSKSNKPIESEHVVHHNIDLYSSDEENDQIQDQNSPKEQFEVYTVMDAARRIEQETINMLTFAKKSSMKNSPSKTSQVSKSPQSIKKPPVQNDIQQEESKSPMKSNMSKNLEQAALKYKIPVTKMNLESVAFSDIVNYESNDDMVSLTGDRITKRSNNTGSKINSAKHSSKDNRSPTGFYNFSRPQMNTDNSQHKVQEIVLNGNNYKDDIAFLTNKMNEVKRESDIVNMDNSSSRTSLATNQVRQKSNYEEVHNKVLDYIPRAEVAINVPARASPKKQYELIVKDVQKHQNHDLGTKKPLKRISEEIAQSKETISSKGKNRSSDKKAKIDNKITPIKQTTGFELQESYTDMVFFDETEQPKTDRSPLADKSIPTKSDAKKSKTYQDSALSIEDQRKRVNKRKLEKKLKQLEELEKIVMEKELMRKKKLWACMVIQRWTKGHLARKKFLVIKSNV